MSTEQKTAALVRGLRKNPNDRELWRALLARVGPPLLHAALALSRDKPHLAEDIVQEALRRFVELKALDRVDPERLLPYLRSIVRNEAVRRARRDKMQKRYEQAATSTVVEANLPSLENRQMIAQAIAHLSPNDKELLQIWLETGSLSEVEGQCNVSYSTGAVRLHRLRKRLAEGLDTDTERSSVKNPGPEGSSK